MGNPICAGTPRQTDAWAVETFWKKLRAGALKRLHQQILGASAKNVTF